MDRIDYTKPLAEQLNQLMHEHFAKTKRHFEHLKINARTDDMYWLIWLAEIGLNSKEGEFSKAIGEGRMRATEAFACLGQWSFSMGQIVRQIESKLNREER